jgi:hypothetical protein
MIPDALDLMVRARALRNQISLPCICLHGDLSGSGVCATLSARGGRRPLRRDCLFCGRRRSGARIHESIDESLDAGSDESLDESIDAGSDEGIGESLGESIDAGGGEGIGESIAERIDASSDESPGASSGESLGPSSGESIH